MLFINVYVSISDWFVLAKYFLENFVSGKNKSFNKEPKMYTTLLSFI